MSTAQHKSYIDVLRILAIFFVILNHTPSFSYPFYTNALGGGGGGGVFVQQWLSCFNKAFAVPCFLMISGALLLPKDEKVSTLLYKRVWKFTQALLLFVSIQYTYYYFTIDNAHDSITIKNFISDVYRCNLGSSVVLTTCKAGTVWYFGIHLGFLLLLPLLRPMAVGMKNITYVYAGGLLMLCTVIIPTLAFDYLGIPKSQFAINARFPTANIFVLCVLLGYYLEYRVNVQSLTVRHWKLLGVVAVVCSILAVHTLNGAIPTLNNIWLMLVPTAIVYLGIKKIFTVVQLSSMWEGVLSKLGSAVFMVMMIEGIVRASLIKVFSLTLKSYWMSFPLALSVLLSWTYLIGHDIIYPCPQKETTSTLRFCQLKREKHTRYR